MQSFAIIIRFHTLQMRHNKLITRLSRSLIHPHPSSRFSFVDQQPPLSFINHSTARNHHCNHRAQRNVESSRSSESFASRVSLLRHYCASRELVCRFAIVGHNHTSSASKRSRCHHISSRYLATVIRLGSHSVAGSASLIVESRPFVITSCSIIEP